MKDILKTLILEASSKKWIEFQKMREFFKGRDPLFDDIISIIGGYYDTYNLFPTYDNLVTKLSFSSDDKIISYISNICQSNIPIHSSDSDFVTALIINQKTQLEFDITSTLLEYQNECAISGSKDKDSILARVENLMAKLYEVKHRVAQSEDSISTLVYGDEAVEKVKQIYLSIEQKRLDNEAVYFDINVKDMNSITMKKGDFVVMGGYTSHGKSVWLRHMIYTFLTKYAMNCCYFSFEMSHNILLPLFNILHANNKEIFPNTPYISNRKYKKGELTEEEKDFLYNVAAEDLANTKKYGTLYLDQPKKSKYSLLDMKMSIKDIESRYMPIHVVGVDYLTLMYPLIESKRSPDMEDYNQMIREFKNYILTHTDKEGNVCPMIGISPAQISRKGWLEAMKNDGRYTLDAIRLYSEMEMSADIVFTTLFTDSMRVSNQLQVQNLKNRDEAVVVDPIQVHCDFDHGYRIGELSIKSDVDIMEAIKNLDI